MGREWVVAMEFSIKFLVNLIGLANLCDQVLALC